MAAVIWSNWFLSGIWQSLFNEKKTIDWYLKAYISLADIMHVLSRKHNFEHISRIFVLS